MISIGRAFALLSLSALVAGPADGQTPSALSGPQALAPQAVSQLEQIYLEKSTRTAAQQKLSTPSCTLSASSPGIS